MVLGGLNMADDFGKLSQLIDKYRDEAINLERLLTSIPALAPENDGDGEAKKAAALKEYLKKAGFPDPEQYDAPDSRVSSGARPNLVYRIAGQDQSKTAWVMAHTDIVPPGDLAKWTEDPYKLRVEGDRIYGRGVEDNQHGLVAAVLPPRRLWIRKPSLKIISGCCLWRMKRWVRITGSDIFSKTIRFSKRMI